MQVRISASFAAVRVPLELTLIGVLAILIRRRSSMPTLLLSPMVALPALVVGAIATSILSSVFKSDSAALTAARQVRDQPRAGSEADKSDGLSAWRESARRRREAALQNSREREEREAEKQREKGQNRGRDGPDYER